jgi:RNA polymerase sigma-70 factor (ECF subfamily)
VPGPEDGRIDAAALFRAHAPFIASFLHRLGAPHADVDDLVQEVFLIAHRKGGYVPGAGRPRTWLAAIAVLIARSAQRARRRRREGADDEFVAETASEGLDPAEKLELRKSLMRVQRALDELDVEHRAAFVLYEIEGEPCDAIAASFGVPVGTVYSRLHHARRRFLEAYAALAPAGSAVARPRLAEGA